MNASQVREFDMSKRVRALADARPADFPAGSRRAELINSLKPLITQAEQYAAMQDAASLDYQEQTEQKRAAINSLLQLLRAINQTARSINTQLPGISDQFKMPRDSDQSILNRARAIFDAATPIAIEFTKRDLPATFLPDLQAAIDSVEAAETRRSNARANQTAATAGLRDTIKQLLAIVKELNAIMHNHYRQDPGSLAAWTSASHVEKAPRKASRKSTPPPSTPST
jgi:hypothetical protein